MAASDLKLMEQDEELWKELECPICFHLLTSRVHLCINGHHVCGTCRAKITNCPFCSSNFLRGPIPLLDSMFNLVRVPCPNRDFGCRKMFKILELPSHRNACSFKTFTCPVDKCEQQMIPMTAWKHIETIHSDILSLCLHMVTPDTGCFKWESGRVREPMIIILKFPSGVKFLYQRKKDISNFFIHYVQCIGSAEVALLFEYELQVHVEKKMFSFVGPVTSITQTSEDIKASGSFLAVCLIENSYNKHDCSLNITIRKKLDVFTDTV